MLHYQYCELECPAKRLVRVTTKLQLPKTLNTGSISSYELQNILQPNFMKYSDALSWAEVSCKKIWLLLSRLRGDWFGPSMESLEWLFLYMDCIALFTVAGSNNGSCISTAEGSSLIRLGNTIVVCGVKGVSTNSRHENCQFPWCSVFWPSANQKRETNLRKIKRTEWCFWFTLSHAFSNGLHS